MKAEDALGEIQRAARQQRLSYTKHALQRMTERNVTGEDIRTAIRECTVGNISADVKKKNCWKLTGPDLDDESLEVVVVLDHDVVVVTVF